MFVSAQDFQLDRSIDASEFRLTWNELLLQLGQLYDGTKGVLLRSDDVLTSQIYWSDQATYEFASQYLEDLQRYKRLLSISKHVGNAKLSALVEEHPESKLKLEPPLEIEFWIPQSCECLLIGRTDLTQSSSREFAPLIRNETTQEFRLRLDMFFRLESVLDQAVAAIKAGIREEVAQHVRIKWGETYSSYRVVDIYECIVETSLPGPQEDIQKSEIRWMLVCFNDQASPSS